MLNPANDTPVATGDGLCYEAATTSRWQTYLRHMAAMQFLHGLWTRAEVINTGPACVSIWTITIAFFSVYSYGNHKIFGPVYALLAVVLSYGNLGHSG